MEFSRCVFSGLLAVRDFNNACGGPLARRMYTVEFYKQRKAEAGVNARNIEAGNQRLIQTLQVKCEKYADDTVSEIMKSAKLRVEEAVKAGKTVVELGKIFDKQINSTDGSEVYAADRLSCLKDQVEYYRYVQDGSSTKRKVVGSFRVSGILPRLALHLAPLGSKVRVYEDNHVIFLDFTNV